jgi:type I restriction enzyme S subunit
VDVKPGYKQTEVGVIPEDWDVRPLKGLAAISHGFGFQSQYFVDRGKYRLMTPGHFHDTGGFRDVGEKQKYYAGPLPEGYLLSDGDLVVAMTEQADGLLGSAALVPIAGTYLHNQRLGKVKPLSPKVSIGFLYRIFNWPLYRARVRETAAGTKVKHTSPGRLLEIVVPMPTTKLEQEAIAEALSDADAYIESTERLLTKKHRLREGAMQELLTGKKRLPGFSGEWQMKRLGDVVDIQKGELITEKNAVPGSIPVIAGGKKPAYFHNRANRFGSTITISGSGASAGYVSFHQTPIFASDCSSIGQGENFAVEFIYLALLLNQNRIYKAQTGGAQPHIHPSDLRPLSIAIPSNKTEQIAIVAILSDLGAEIAVLEKKVAKARALKHGMMQELLTGTIRLV